MTSKTDESNEMCLVCLEINQNIIGINLATVQESLNGLQITFREMLIDFMELEILNGSNLPQSICQGCSEDLKISYSFRKKCMNSEIILKNFQEIDEVNSNFGESESFSVMLDRHDYTPKSPSEAGKLDEQGFDLENSIDSKTLSIAFLQFEKDPNTFTPAFPCRKCEKCFLTYGELNDHNAVHSTMSNLICRFCGKKFLHDRHVAPHINKEHFSELQYSCGYCNYIVKKISEMEIHLKDHQSADENRINCEYTGQLQHICDICQASFKSKSMLKRHLLTHNPDRPFRCKYEKCKWSFAVEDDLLTHTAVNHSDNTTNECVFCQKTFKAPRLLRQHMISHKRTKRFTCQYCQKGFNLQHHLKKHELTHSGEHPFLCSKCGKRFITKDRLVMHTKTHSDEKPYKCDQCDRSYRIATRLRSHQKEQHSVDRAFMCSVCGITFVLKQHLTKHMASVHGDNSHGGQISFCALCQSHFETEHDLNSHMKAHAIQYQCDICLKTFPLRGSLEAHMRLHSIERAHKCTECNAAFNRPEHLKAHTMRKHTGIKPFKCELCDKTFYQSGELNIHMRRHTGERPYKCDYCPKAFMQSNALRFHTRTHTGEKPYKCAVCNKGHALMGGLISHMKTHNRQATKLLENSDRFMCDADNK